MNDQKYRFQVEADVAGLRLDTALSHLVPDCSRSAAQRLVDDGNVYLDGIICAIKKTKLQEGQVLDVRVPQQLEYEVLPEDLPLDICYEDDQVLVVNKPRDMLVHPTGDVYAGTLANRILAHCPDITQEGAYYRRGIVHRIDRDTSGLLVVAKTDHAFAHLSAQFYVHSITRKYVALVHGTPEPSQDVIRAQIGRDPKNRIKRTVVEEGGRQATTHYRVLEYLPGFSLVEAILETGRTHQIRVHMSHRGHPLAGDWLYGKTQKEVICGRKIDGQLLHAAMLGFSHPEDGRYLEFTCPLPDLYTQVLQDLRAQEGNKREQDACALPLAPQPPQMG